MLDELTDTSLSAAMLTSILFEHRNGGNPWVTYSQAATCLNALGRPISEATVRSLIVKTSILNGKAVAPLGRFVEAADDYIARADQQAEPEGCGCRQRTRCEAEGRLTDGPRHQEAPGPPEGGTGADCLAKVVRAGDDHHKPDLLAKEARFSARDVSAGRERAEAILGAWNALDQLGEGALHRLRRQADTTGRDATAAVHERRGRSGRLGRFCQPRRDGGLRGGNPRPAPRSAAAGAPRLAEEDGIVRRAVDPIEEALAHMNSLPSRAGAQSERAGRPGGHLRRPRRRDGTLGTGGRGMPPSQRPAPRVPVRRAGLSRG